MVFRSNEENDEQSINDGIYHNDESEDVTNTKDNEDCMLTTYDNPFNPFTQFELWFKYDMLHGYNTCIILSRTANTNPIQSDYYNNADIIDAIDYICKEFPLLYKKVYKSDYNNDEKVETIND